MKRPELYGVSELADRWGVTKQRASEICKQYIEKKLLGPPAELRCGPIWTGRQIKEFEMKWPREIKRNSL